MGIKPIITFHTVSDCYIAAIADGMELILEGVKT